MSTLYLLTLENTSRSAENIVYFIHYVHQDLMPIHCVNLPYIIEHI